MADRLIPPCNVAAAEPNQIYNIEDIIPLHVTTAIDVKVIWKARETIEAFEALAPFQYDLSQSHLFL